MTDEELKKELSNVCKEIDELRKKHKLGKRTHGLHLILKFLRKKYKIHIPTKYKNNEYSELYLLMKLIHQKGFLLGKISERETIIDKEK